MNELTSLTADVVSPRRDFPFKDETGKKFGRLTIESYLPKRTNKSRMCVCRCECGNTKTVRVAHLSADRIKSCGCLKNEMLRARLTKHGFAKNGPIMPEYGTWQNMLNRCRNPKTKSFNRYGGRGLSVCSEWKESFENFYRDMGQKPSPHHSIERKNNNEGYSKENCEWSLQIIQANNTCTNRLINFEGQTMTMAQWARKLSIKYHTLAARLNRHGWSVQRAFTT